ncbi:hypothetical protein D6D19_00174 [Aureobasidium pullulans]|uniref:MARVEL domain-containing protein n=1 Tax=Aureobasidium pullulans TaxID=5580 RepID=A0A4S9AMZ9_AURPU|nr:hypothetical protein D6D28_00314 [Aureobasidium pullulans]THV89592.1 hypothetical protein D6D26_09711 [Aureobasidium pullulans]THW00669.1 hypothetical protein D6D25_08829 [Aureobasidium pullulans]THW21039.1 hypothetical protein D6D24_01956 [Aureobasidium pullulans]THW29269.1 hypothetical protein D6D23_01204 [Aureobasidium pullulans]
MASFFDRIRNDHVFQKVMRVIQFLSAIISLGLFSSRMYKVYRLVRSVRNSSGAVEGILAAATLYTIITLLINLCLKRGAPKFLRWLLIFLDLVFVVGFIVVAVLTRPHGGLSSLCATSRQRNDPNNRDNALCKLPLATFGLAIFSTILHFITAVFHEARDHHRNKKASQSAEEEMKRSQDGLRN